MRTRYFRNNDGSLNIKASVYELLDHGISKNQIDQDVLSICSRLKFSGHEAYVVGGAIRDLLLGRKPKDFDIATDAAPNRVRKIFRNSRIIGRRFRLVHIFFRDGHIHEVATFRAPDSGDRNHVFGTLPEDAMRRDFSMNALYYDPEEETIIDFVGGVHDIHRKVVKSVLPLHSSFIEDPVRMLRAIKYAAISGMRIAPAVGRRIRKQNTFLANASLSRLSEELYKILNSRNAEPIFRLMDKYNLIGPLLPEFDKLFRNVLSRGKSLKATVFLELAKMDQHMLRAEMSRGEMIRCLTENLLVHLDALKIKDGNMPVFSDVVHTVKTLLCPLVQPNRDVEEAVKLMFTERGYPIPERKPRRTRFRSDERPPSRRRKKRIIHV